MLFSTTAYATETQGNFQINSLVEEINKAIDSFNKVPEAIRINGMVLNCKEITLENLQAAEFAERAFAANSEIPVVNAGGNIAASKSGSDTLLTVPAGAEAELRELFKANGIDKYDLTINGGKLEWSINREPDRKYSGDKSLYNGVVRFTGEETLEAFAARQKESPTAFNIVGTDASSKEVLNLTFFEGYRIFNNLLKQDKIESNTISGTVIANYADENFDKASFKGNPANVAIPAGGEISSIVITLSLKKNYYAVFGWMYFGGTGALNAEGERDEQGQLVAHVGQ